MVLHTVATMELSRRMRKHARVREMSIKISLIPVNLSVSLAFSVDDGFWSSGSEEGLCKLSSCSCSTANSASGISVLSMAVVGPAAWINSVVLSRMKASTHASKSDLGQLRIERRVSHERKTITRQVVKRVHRTDTETPILLVRDRRRKGAFYCIPHSTWNTMHQSRTGPGGMSIPRFCGHAIGPLMAENRGQYDILATRLHKIGKRVRKLLVSPAHLFRPFHSTRRTSFSLPAQFIITPRRTPHRISIEGTEPYSTSGRVGNPAHLIQIRLGSGQLA